jgi:hypothetical protein
VLRTSSRASVRTTLHQNLVHHTVYEGALGLSVVIYIVEIGGEDLLQLLIRLGYLGMLPEVISERDVPMIPVATGHAYVDIHESAALGVLELEETMSGLIVRPEFVTKFFEGDSEKLLGLKAVYRDLDIDDVFGRESRDGCRSDVIDADCDRTERSPNSGSLTFEPPHPLIAILDDLDRHSPKRIRAMSPAGPKARRI